MRLIVSLLFLACTACGGSEWIHDTANTATFNADTYDCEMDTRRSHCAAANDGSLLGVAMAVKACKTMYDLCMVARGYSKADGPTVADAEYYRPVSYTHLTLPTIYSV